MAGPAAIRARCDSARSAGACLEGAAAIFPVLADVHGTGRAARPRSCRRRGQLFHGSCAAALLSTPALPRLPRRLRSAAEQPASARALSTPKLSQTSTFCPLRPTSRSLPCQFAACAPCCRCSCSGCDNSPAARCSCRYTVPSALVPPRPVLEPVEPPPPTRPSSADAVAELLP